MSFLAFNSSAQLKESIISQLFPTTRPHGMHTDFKVQVCRGGGILLPQPRNFSDLKLPVPVLKKDTVPGRPISICIPYGNLGEGINNMIPGSSIQRVGPAMKEQSRSATVVVYCPGISRPAPKPKQDTIKNQFVCKIGGLNIQTVSTSTTGKMTCVNKNPADATRKDTSIKPAPIRLVSCRTINGDSQPLIIINGNLSSVEEMNSIDLNSIENITILKGAQATAIAGSQGENGLIVINLKLNYKKMVVIDGDDSSPVAGASVGITMKNGDNTMFYVVDDKGSFSSNSPKEFNGLKMTVTAVGYETKAVYFNDDISKTDTIRLSRDIKICGEVVVSGTWCPKRIRCSYRITRLIPRGEKEEGTNAFKCYPNPVQKGGAISISFKNAEKNISHIRVLSLGGMEMLKQGVSDVKGTLVIQTDPRWSAGVYFVQLVYENGRVAASERIIIQ